MHDEISATIDACMAHFGVVLPQSVQETSAAEELESMGWREVLMELMPFAFEEEFSPDHERFWDLFWSVLLRIREQRKFFNDGTVKDDVAEAIEAYEESEQHKIDDKATRRRKKRELARGLAVQEAEQERIFRENGIWVEPDEYAVLLILGRGLGKSATIEAAAVIRGCLLGGYCLYICEAADQASEHVGNVKILISHEESKVVEFYPHMAIDVNAKFQGKRTSNRHDLFVTVGGFVCRAKGLEAKLRGIRVGKLRPDMIILDDVDSVGESIAVSMGKLKQITSSAIPTQSRRHATILVGQNLISETGVVNMIYTGRTDALSARTTIGVSNTFERFRLNHEYITYLDEKDGRFKHKILPAAVPTWSGVRISDAQKFLNDSGLETFLAEYMNSFAHQQNEKVFAFDEKRHLITWDAFEAMFGVRHIPGHWRAKASADLGYSKESLSAWFFAARSAKNSKLPGRYFAYRSKTFMFDSIDDQAIALWKDLFPQPEIGKKHFEATQRFVDYPDLFRVLDASANCSRYLKQFNYNPVKDRYDLKKLTMRNIDEVSDEEKALFYVKQAHVNFRSQIQSWVVSHEKTGEQKTLAQKYGIPVAKVARFGADDGVAEANHLLRGDYTMPHPFYPDEIVPETGLYKLGSPYIFFIVRRIQAPEGDEDMKTFREQVSGQRWTQEKLTDLGLSKPIPMKYKSDHCLVAGTMITTSRGQVPIEDIEIGDMILTRQGYRRCRDAMMTCEAAPIWSLTTSNGLEIRGTSGHKVWIENKGFTPLELAKCDDILAICETNQSLEKPSFLKGSISTDILTRTARAINGITAGFITGVKLGSMLQSGSLQTVNAFPKAMQSTTSITTGTTTAPKTWNAYRAAHTKVIMRLNQKASQRLKAIWTKLARLQKSGTEARLDLNGIVNTQKARSLRQWFQSRSFVSIAASQRPQKRRGDTSFAQRDASNGTRTGFLLRRLLDRARSVLRNSQSSTDEAKLIESIARASVLAVRPTSDVLPVYNLSVDGVSEYFANGVLVRNCDALRMFCVDYALPESTPKTIHEEVQDRIDDKYKPKEGQIVTPEQQMSFMAAKEEAEERVKRELGLDDESDADDDADMW